MKKTIEIAKDKSHDKTKTVLPAEYAKSVFVNNVPSLQAIKLMYFLIDAAKDNMGKDRQHEASFASLRNITGIKNHSKDSLKELLIELRAAVLSHEDFDKKEITIGGLIDKAIVDYATEESGDLKIKWFFSRTFQDMAKSSNHWAILDKQTAFSLKSKYSVLLFQHISSLVNLSYIHSKIFKVSELRSIMGVTNDKMPRFANFNARAIQPAIEEINHLSRFDVSARLIKSGRNITSVVLSWEKKANIKPVQRELDFASVGRKSRRNNTAETIVDDVKLIFPNSVSIRFTNWYKIACECLPYPMRDADLVANDFRKFCGAKNIALDAPSIEKTFRTFCSKQKPAQ